MTAYQMQQCAACTAHRHRSPNHQKIRSDL